MDNFIGGVAALAVSLVLNWAAYSFGQIAVLDDCNDFGKAKIGGTMIECKKVAQPAGEKP